MRSVAIASKLIYIIEEVELLNLLNENNLSVSFPIQEINAPKGIRQITICEYVGLQNDQP